MSKVSTIVVILVAVVWWAVTPGSLHGRKADGEPAAAEQLLAQCGELAAAGTSPAVAGPGGWWFARSELRHLGAGVFWGEAARDTGRAASADLRDPLPAIVDLDRQLSQKGIALLLVPVPPKAVIYPEELSRKLASAEGSSGPARRLDVHDAAFYEELGRRGVEVLDLVPAMLEARRQREGRGESLFCRTDAHWSPAGCELAAQQIARWIGERFSDDTWFNGVSRSSLESEEEPLHLSGDLVHDVAADACVRCEETVTIRKVGTLAAGQLKPVQPDRSSPVLLMADSHGLVYHAGGDMFAEGAGLPDQLALALGFPVDLIAVRGSAASATRMALLRRASAPGYLEGKRVVIWCFAARELTESLSGWRVLPLERPSERSAAP